jgi:hypothetical protein
MWRRARFGAGRLQEAFDLLGPGRGGRAQLEQTLAHNNELVSHVLNLGDCGGILMRHEICPIG